MTKAVEELRDLNLEKESLLARKNAIKKALSEHRDTLTDEEITKNETEVNELLTREKDIEARAKVLQEEIDKENEKIRSKKMSDLDFETRERLKKEAEERGAALKRGEAIKIEYRATTTSSTALKVTAGSDIHDPFAQTSSLDEMVKTVDMNGGESYKAPFEKTITAGGMTAEGADYSTAEPTFGYATISKQKITAYAEITEEVLKLPNANYEARITEAVRIALRKKLNQQIINGTGTEQLVGILNAPTTTIEAARKRTIATLDENTIDDIVYTYGGDESVEGNAYLIMNKLTLKQLAKVRGTQDKKKVYDIKLNANGLTGTIDTIPFVLTSNVSAYSSELAAGTPYMYYGKLNGYELAMFSNVEVRRSEDYKFKSGMIAYKASVMVGGAPAAWNGFDSIVRAAQAK